MKTKEQKIRHLIALGIKDYKSAQNAIENIVKDFGFDDEETLDLANKVLDEFESIWVCKELDTGKQTIKCLDYLISIVSEEKREYLKLNFGLGLI